jgi:hypothetical protein
MTEATRHVVMKNALATRVPLKFFSDLKRLSNALRLGLLTLKHKKKLALCP